jgi:hypothetical protein
MTSSPYQSKLQSFVARAPFIDISARHTKDCFDENRREGMAVLYRWA